MIPIRFKYTYKNYTYSPKATKYSKMLGILTCTAMCLVYALFWFMLFYGVLVLMGVSEDASLIVSLVSLIGLYISVKKIKSKIEIKIEKIAADDLKKQIKF